MLRVAAVLACAALSGAAFAQSYPSKPIRIVVAYPPGGAADLLARTLQPRMQSVLGQPGVIENRGGAGGQIGAQQVAVAAPDGYTVLATVGPAHLLAKYTTKGLAYDPVKDFTPITAGFATVLSIAANASFPPNSVAELIEHARRNPGKVSFGTTAIGGEAHLSMEYVKALGRVEMTHVPYKGGGPATTDLVGNHIPLLVLPVSTVMEHVNKGSVKILGVIFPKRFTGLPNVPTVAEQVPGFQSSGSWIGILGPAKLPEPIALRWHSFVSQTLNEKETREKLESIGQFVLASTPKELAEQINASMPLYEKMVKAAGIKPE
jgi:tripartite-type tricarboxylate transporter receptor subunit TctC